MKADCSRGYSWGYFVFVRGYFHAEVFFGGTYAANRYGNAARSKPSDKAYRLSDGGSLFLWVTPGWRKALAVEVR